MALTPAQKKAEAAKEAKAAKAEESKEEAEKDAAPTEPAKEEAPAESKDDAAKEPAKEEAPAESKAKTMKVMNPHPRFHYTHPASGARLGAGEVKELVRDPWLEMQCEAGVLKEV